MSEINVLSYAKINISLDVISKRSDGYHNLKSVMQTVSLADNIRIRTGAAGIKVKTNLPYLASDSQNIAFKAAELFYEAVNLKPDIYIEIEKRIPVGAGLGGGSSNAASVLRALNSLHDNPLDDGRLYEIGLMCGADVPFCMRGGTCLAESLGEVLTPLPPLPDCGILLVKPPFSIRTKQVFESLNLSKIKARPDTGGILHALHEKNTKDIAVRMFNVLEAFVGKHRETINEIKGKMLDSGALGSVMSGSGSCVFGIFNTIGEAERAAGAFKDSFESVFVARAVI